MERAKRGKVARLIMVGLRRRPVRASVVMRLLTESLTSLSTLMTVLFDCHRRPQEIRAGEDAGCRCGLQRGA
jgi:hypothetical protein